MSLHIRCYIRIRRFVRKIGFKQFWYLHTGDWHWLKEKPVPVASINRSLWRASVPSFGFHFMLGLSAIISTLGLLANSVAIIIGAMIIAPLISPIMGITYATVMGNRKLLNRSSLTLLSGVFLTVVLSWIIAVGIGFKTVDSEILSRTNPTLIDLGIAMAAGAAGAFANTRRRIADALPGVAIAVALVPPLSVIGISLALGEFKYATGAFLLFSTNLISIIFFGGLVFLFQSYGSIDRAKHGLFFSICMLLILGLPLSFSLRSLLLEKNVRYQVINIILSQADIVDSSTLQSVKVQENSGKLEITVKVLAPAGSIEQSQLREISSLLASKLAKKIDLELQVIPVEVLSTPASP